MINTQSRWTFRRSKRLPYVHDTPPVHVSAILYCRCRQVLSEDYLTGDQYEGPDGLIFLRRKDYNQIWIHQFLRVKVIRHLFEQFPDEIPYAGMMDDLKDKLIPPDSHCLYVTKGNLAIFGESTLNGKLTLNCSKSMADHGLDAPKSMPLSKVEVTMGELNRTEFETRSLKAPASSSRWSAIWRRVRIWRAT